MFWFLVWYDDRKRDRSSGAVKKRVVVQLAIFGLVMLVLLVLAVANA